MPSFLVIFLWSLMRDVVRPSCPSETDYGALAQDRSVDAWQHAGTSSSYLSAPFHFVLTNIAYLACLVYLTAQPTAIR